MNNYANVLAVSDLSAVAPLGHLTYLDVSFNKLTSILDTVNSTNLIVRHTLCVTTYMPHIMSKQEANYSHNEIEILGDLGHHNSLTILKLSCILKTSIVQNVLPCRSKATNVMRLCTIIIGI